MFRALIASFALALALALGGAAAARPVVVILADARGTVAADLTTPYAILAESGAVDVKVAAATRAPARLTPGYAWVAPQTTFAELDRGPAPDVIIVPALTVVEDPVRAAWLRAQLRGGARIMSICNGAKVLAAAGLLDGRQAVVHWYSHARMQKRHPAVTWRRDRRWVSDGPITTTAGISAAEPATLHLLGEIAGDAVMRQTAQRLALPLPDPRHRGEDFRLTLRSRALVVGNVVAFWRQEDVALPLAPGFDEFAFGAALDGWSRTWRSTAWADGPAAVRSRRGLLVYRAKTPPARFDRRAPLPGARVTEGVFAQIRRAYGEPTARFVALQFEHPWGAVGRPARQASRAAAPASI